MKQLVDCKYIRILKSEFPTLIPNTTTRHSCSEDMRHEIRMTVVEACVS